MFDVDEKLLVMRPYQIVATERILNRVLISENDKSMLGTLRAGGYVWHTTGSGKTLTSFKTAQLASQMAGVDKVMFVVDRKDLDYQTMREYDRFEKGAVDGSESTAVLAGQLSDPECRILATTIQKLSCFIKKNKKHDVYAQHCVIIFDECHRSQFGEMHVAITKHFKNYHLFGFTGTPIFAEKTPAAAATSTCAPPSRPSGGEAAHLHHRGRHPRRERSAFPRGLHQHHSRARSVRGPKRSTTFTAKALIKLPSVWASW